ncbi:Chromosome-anchoring protein RacA [Paenibacillus plantiphilus]|uniref:Chromosome-anchoring protein RacA n=1 Tax=Paenibacillus plantiphilus TaxID=2905650 RepID=A0ABM9CMT3_9BACL|nr:MerR family transcriptional regulator [Paenibacillus plantiphilus]CAH1217384.1 Chromosome-anchoring protein RacA [Paenibacillus plantiphilus]
MYRIPLALEDNEVIEMGVLKTKDTAVALGVSPTTVKRWVLHFSHCFQKDRLGHYVFSEQDIRRLQHIKSRIEQGSTLEQIELPSLDVAGAEGDGTVDNVIEMAGNAMIEHVRNEINELNEAHARDNTGEESAELMSQIRQIEYTLAHKADEVVSMQVLQHRLELDELRRIVEQLVLSVEALQKPKLRPLTAFEEPASPPPAKPQIRHKKRGLLRLLFQFL